MDTVEPRLSGLVGLDEIDRIIEGPDNRDMNINEEQKLIILRERHLIVKQNIHKSFLKKVWSTPSLSVENTSTSVY